MKHTITSWDDDDNEREISIEIVETKHEESWDRSVLLVADVFSNGKVARVSRFFDFDPFYGWESFFRRCSHERKAYQAIGLCSEEIEELWDVEGLIDDACDVTLQKVCKLSAEEIQYMQTMDDYA